MLPSVRVLLCFLIDMKNKPPLTLRRHGFCSPGLEARFSLTAPLLVGPCSSHLFDPLSSPRRRI